MQIFWGSLSKFSKTKKTWWSIPLWQCGYRRDTCPKFYNAGISGQKFHTAKVRILDIVQSRHWSVNTLNISNLGNFHKKMIELKMSLLIMPGKCCFTEKFTPLAKKLRCHWQCLQWQISPLCGYRNINLIEYETFQFSLFKLCMIQIHGWIGWGLLSGIYNKKRKIPYPLLFPSLLIAFPVWDFLWQSLTKTKIMQMKQQSAIIDKPRQKGHISLLSHLYWNVYF